MNQILITKKLYITPELKRKKKVYKFDFFLSIFLVCILTSVCIYAEYDRNKSEQVSQSILENIEIDDTIVAKSDVLVVVLDERNNVEQEEQIPNSANTPETQNSNNNNIVTTNEGFQYTTIATINIPKIGVTYPIIDGPTDSVEETAALLKISPTKFWGPEPNKIGNFCVVGHNYRNSRFFSKVPNLENGDIIELTDIASGKTLQYSVYDKYQVYPEDRSCTSQLTNGRKDITLITCTNDSEQRVIVKATVI